MSLTAVRRWVRRTLARRRHAPEPVPPPRDLGMLAARIRHAWLAVDAAIPWPDDIRLHPGIMCEGLDDPRAVAILQARDAAFGWALAELIERGGYATPGWILGALGQGTIPGSGEPG